MSGEIIPTQKKKKKENFQILF